MAKTEAAGGANTAAVAATLEAPPADVEKSSVLLKVTTPFLDHFQYEDAVIHREPTVVKNKTTASKIIDAAAAVGVVVKIVED